MFEHGVADTTIEQVRETASVSNSQVPDISSPRSLDRRQPRRALEIFGG
jgi:hypothetical protein